MKIVHLSTNYSPVNKNIRHGGVERVIFYLTLQQKRYPGNNLAIIGMKGTFVEGVECIEVYDSNIQEIRLLNVNLYKKIMDQTNQVIYSYLINNDVDIIHDHFGSFTTSNECDEMLRKDHKKRIIVTIYGLPGNPYYKNIYKKLSLQLNKYKNQIHCYCVSMDHKELFSKTHLVSGFVYNGIDPKEFIFNKSKENYYLSLASLVEEKGHGRCLEWARKTNNNLLIIGKPDYRITKKSFLEYINNNSYNAKDLIIDNDPYKSFQKIYDAFKKHNIIYIESVSEYLKKIVISKAKALFMLVTWREPFAITILESLASGTPVIGSNLGSIREAIDEKTGFIIDEENDINVATEIIHTLSPYDCKERLVTKFSNEIMATKYSIAYKKILDS